MTDLREVAQKWWSPPDGIVGKLPRVTCPQCSKKACTDPSHKPTRCAVCKAFISPKHIHLDFVGHSDLTRTLIEIDPEWQWEPVSFDDGGSPRVTKRGAQLVLWGRLTLLGKSMLCVGTSDDKADADKELVGDLLRNGAMRFGIFGALWSKTDGWQDDDTPPQGVDVTKGGDDAPLTATPNGSERVPTVPAQNSYVLAAANPPEKPLAAMTAGEMARYGDSIGVRVSGSKAEIMRQLEPIVLAATGAEPFDIADLPEPQPGQPTVDINETPFDPTVAEPLTEIRNLKPAVRAAIRRGTE